MRTYILLINYGYFIKGILRIYEAYLTVNPGMVLYVNYGGSSMRRENYAGVKYAIRLYRCPARHGPG
jgi:hypothetical protein